MGFGSHMSAKCVGDVCHVAHVSGWDNRASSCSIDSPFRGWDAVEYGTPRDQEAYLAALVTSLSVRHSVSLSLSLSVTVWW